MRYWVSAGILITLSALLPVGRTGPVWARITDVVLIMMAGICIYLARRTT